MAKLIKEYDDVTQQVEQKTIDGLLESGADELMSWRNEWLTGTYKKNDVVRDNDWTMVANKLTLDRPSPQPSGVVEWKLPTSPVWVPRIAVNDISYGAYIEVINTSIIHSIRLWVPDETYDFTVQVWDLDYPATPILIDSRVVQAGNEIGWLGIDIDSDVLLSGSKRLFNCIAHNPATDIDYTDIWRNLDQTPPGAGIVNRSSATEILINKTAGGAGSGANRGADLLLLKSGDVITLTATSDTSRYVQYLVTAAAVDSGSYVTLTVEIQSEGSTILNNSDVAVDWTVSTPSSVNFKELTDFFLSSPNISGYLNIDVGSPDTPILDDNAYGIDISLESYVESPDWDVLAFANSIKKSAPVSTVNEIILTYFVPVAGVTDNQFPMLGTFFTETSNETGDYLPNISGQNQHIFLLVNALAGTGTITVNGTSVDGSTAVPQIGQSEVINIDALGYYQSLKKWLEVTSITIAGMSSIDYDIGRIGYYDFFNVDYKVKAIRADIRIQGNNPDISIRVRKVKDNVNNKFELVTIENYGFDSTGGNGSYFDNARTGIDDRGYTMTGVELADNNAEVVFKFSDYNTFFTAGENVITGANNEGIIVDFLGLPTGGITSIDHVTLQIVIQPI